MSLGSKLSTTLTELEVAKKRKKDAQTLAQTQAIRKERLQRDQLVDRIIEHITSKIEGGMVPCYKVEDYTLQGWVRDGQKGKAAHQDIWDRLTTWAAEQELTVIPEEAHDGVGIRSWIEVVAKPVQA